MRSYRNSGYQGGVNEDMAPSGESQHSSQALPFRGQPGVRFFGNPDGVESIPMQEFQPHVTPHQFSHMTQLPGGQVGHFMPPQSPQTLPQPLQTPPALPTIAYYPGIMPLQTPAYNHPVQPHMQGYSHPGIPAPQYMVRDYSTPMPKGFQNPSPPAQTFNGCVFLKRLVSVGFIILDAVINWWHFIDETGGSELLEDVQEAKDLLDIIKKGKKFSFVNCEVDSKLVVAKGAFTALASIWAGFQIINIIGETITEYTRDGSSRTDAENNPNSDRKHCFRGFQILHGWMETIISFGAADLPLAIISLLLGVQCRVENVTLGKAIGWMFSKSLKNIIRRTTCKQKYKPCVCCKDCCVYYCDIPCACLVCIGRLCPSGQEKCCDIEFYDFCPKRKGTCFGEIIEDPDWALRFTQKLDKLYFWICFVAIGLPLVKNILHTS